MRSLHPLSIENCVYYPNLKPGPEVGARGLSRVFFSPRLGLDLTREYTVAMLGPKGKKCIFMSKEGLNTNITSLHKRLLFSLEAGTAAELVQRLGREGCRLCP